MMELDEFKKYMEQIVNMIRFEDDLADLCISFRQEDCRITFPNMLDSCVNLLSFIMNDEEEEWISYWVFELDCGKKYEPGMVRDADGTEIPLATIEDLYNLLIYNSI